jgi:hypothetical protein
MPGMETSIMPLTDLLGAISAHQWLPLLVLLALYVRKLLSSDSKFPITISPNMLPTVSGALSLIVTVVGAREAGKTWALAALSGFIAAVAMGFFDGLLAAIFGDPSKAPSWAKAIVYVVDDLGGGKKGQGGFIAVGLLARVAGVTGVVTIVIVSAGAVFSEAACTKPQAVAVAQDLTPAGACVVNDIVAKGVQDPVQILKDCGGITIDGLYAIVEQLLGWAGDAGTSAVAAAPSAYQLRLLNLKLQLVAMGAK